MAEIDVRTTPPVRGGDGYGHVPPAPFQEGTAADEGVEDRSLLEDLEALYHDGRTYVSAEIAFQKTRASYAGKKLQSVAIFGAGAALAGLLALIGLTVGLIITLATLIGPLAATLVVVGVLLIAAFLCMRRAGKKWSELSGAFKSGDRA